MNTRSITLMLVDDNPADRELTKLALSRVKLVNGVLMAEDGQEALDILEDPDQPVPDLILLDLNMPGMDGREFLKTVKEDARFKHIPVIVLTTSDASEDIDQSYQNHSAGYIQKPVGLDGLTKVVQALDGYWFAIVKLPNA